MVPLAIVWACLMTSGQIGLLLLLLTIFLASPALPQSRNPYFVNFLLITFVKSIPECMMFFSTNSEPPKWACLLQIGIFNGAPALYHTALLILALHTWASIRSGSPDTTPFTMYAGLVRISFIFFPYLVFAICATLSMVAASHSTQLDMIEPLCYDNSSLGSKIRGWVTYYGIAVGGISLFLQSWIIYFIYKHNRFHANIRFEGIEKEFSHYRISFLLYVRLFVFCILQLVMLLVSALVVVAMVRTDALLMVQAILQVSDALQIFLIFGTQRTVVDTWRRWSLVCFSRRSRAKAPKGDDETQSQAESCNSEHNLMVREVPTTIP